ncbi:CHAT domain-containing protein [Nibrella viscosa]|uniref:CHAT domain-containing protein n=1 Tax=Nibrella viscosa TaxID=1084524 RepID=A0ABP8K2B0_9BACT
MKSALFWITLFFIAGEARSQHWQTAYDSSKTYFNAGDYERAISLLLTVLPETESRYQANPKGDSTYTRTLQLLGDCYWWAGNYPATEAFFLKYLAVIRERQGEQNQLYSSRLGDLGALYYDMGRYDEAEKLYRHTLELDRLLVGEGTVNYTTTLNNLAVLYDGLGRYEKAEPLYRQVIAQYKKLQGDQHINYGTAINNLATLYYALGRYEDAKPLYEESLEIRRKTKGENSREYANGLHNLNALYEVLGRYRESESLLRKALAIRRTLGEKHPEYLISLSGLAKILTQLNRYDEALDTIRRVIRLRTEVLGPKHADLLNSLTILGAIYAKTGRLRQADSLFTYVADTRRELFSETHPAYAQALHNRAAVMAMQRQYRRAEQLADQALQSYISQINTYFSGLSEQEQADFFNSIRNYFESYHTLGLLLHKQQPEVVGRQYNHQLITKALLLNTLLKTRRRILSSQDSTLIRLYTGWQQQRETLAHVYRLSKADRQKQGIDLDSLEATANQLEKDLSAQSALFVQATAPASATWRDVQKVLKPGEAAVEMVRFRRYTFDSAGRFTDTVHYAALIVRPGSRQPQLVLIPNGNALEGPLLHGYRHALRRQQPLADFYAYYWQPLDAALSGVHKVYFSPDGVYHLVNPATLPRPQSGRYVTDMYQLIHLTTTRDLLQRATALPHTGVATLIGFPEYGLSATQQAQLIKEPLLTSNLPPAQLGEYRPVQLERGREFTPLPGTKAEVTQIDRLLTQHNISTKTFLAERALEEVVKAQVRPRLLHIATHGYFEPDSRAGSPVLLRSGLALAGAQRSLTSSAPTDPLAEHPLDDGLLTAYEATTLQLDGTDLVVLSACETGLGEVRNGEGVYGLQRAFRVAGAQSVLFSLWKVDDEATQTLMATFYTHWLQSGDKTQALQQARQRLRQEPRFSHPFFWGAFVLIGE